MEENKNFYNRIIKLLGGPLLSVTIMFGAGFLGAALTAAPGIISELRYMWLAISENPLLITAGLGILGIIIFTLGFLLILLGTSITDAASSLGYSTSSSTQDKIISEKGDRYDPGDMLSPLLIARLRLIDHINTLRNNAVTNLFIGIGIAAIGVVILFWAIIQIGSMQLDDTHNIRTSRVVALVMFPKLSITIFIQIFSYFFLAMYRSNQQEIRYFQNEITTIDSFASALMASNQSGPALKIVLTALSKNERNRVIKKGEKSIISSDEAEFIQAMSVISRIKENTNLLNK